MPKTKSHRGSKKRMKLTANGHVRKSSPYKSHLMSSKNGKRKRKLRKLSIASKCDEKRLRALLS